MENIMRAAVWSGVDDVRVQEMPLPEVPDGWALVRVEYTGICGTDLAIVHGKHPRARHGLVLGHEIVGRVESPGASGAAAGAHVVVEPLISCGTCRACREGQAHVCAQLGLFGIDEPGGAAQFVALPPSALHEVPSHVDLARAALAEPLAVAVHAVRRSGMEEGDIVAVYGAGPIGILTALVARHEGASQVIVSDPNPRRLDVATAMGFTVVAPAGTMLDTIAELTGGDGADTTFDSAAHPSVAAEVAGVTRVRGRVVVVGVYKDPPSVDLQAVCFKEQTIIGVRVYTVDDVRRAIDLIAGDELSLDLFPLSVYGLDRISEALVAAVSGNEGLKVLVTPEGGDLV